MRHVLPAIVFLLTLLSLPGYAWGPQGHRLVALIARSQLDHEVISTIDYYLKGTSWEEAATWMDDVEMDPGTEDMTPWHYIYIGKDKTYVKTKEENIINRLEFCLRMLEFRIYQPEESVQTLLKVLFHLVGDIHQPLHCGYEEDQGGRTIPLYLIQKETNLHRVWDTDIISNKNMDMWYLAKVLIGMKLPEQKRQELEKTDVVAWMQESRLLLPSVYALQGKKLDQQYIDNNAPLVEQQLIKAGLRLAAILNRYFK
jgi:hypothetical protein